MHHPHHYVLSLYWARWAKVQSTSQPMPSDPDRVSEWCCDGWEGRHSMQRTIYLTTRSRRWDHWLKWKMHGAVREEGDLILTPEHRAGEKGSGGWVKNQRGRRDAATAPMNGSRRQGHESQWRVVGCLTTTRGCVTCFSLDRVVVVVVLVYVHTSLWRELWVFSVPMTQPEPASHAITWSLCKVRVDVHRITLI